jgi:hypothetical protein
VTIISNDLNEPCKLTFDTEANLWAGENKDYTTRVLDFTKAELAKVERACPEVALLVGH